MKNKQTLLIAIFLIFFLACQTKNTPMFSLDETIEKHFTAIHNRSLQSLLETVDEHQLTLILPNGKYTNSLADYKQTNADWFSDQDWKIEYEIIDKIINDNTAIILAKINYQDINEKGETYSFQYFLTLIFKETPQGWKLFFDQNTSIK